MNTLILFIGKAGSGKTTAATVVRNFLDLVNDPKLAQEPKRTEIIKFAQPLYKLHDMFFKSKNRRFLLFLGNVISLFGLRSLICKKWAQEVSKAFKDRGISYVICDDLRFPQEVDAVYKLAMNRVFEHLVVVYVNTSLSNCLERTGNSLKQAQHNSESYLDRNWNHFRSNIGPTLENHCHIMYNGMVIPNNDTKDTFVKAIIKYMEEVL